MPETLCTIIFLNILGIEVKQKKHYRNREGAEAPEDEAEVVFIVQHSHTVICEDTMVVHIIDASVTPSTMTNAIVFTLEAATLTYVA